MTKSTTLFFCLLAISSLLTAQTNLIQNPGFEAAVSTFTVPVGTPAVNHLMKIANYTSLITETTQPTATSVTVTDGLWVKKQSISSSSTQAYLSAGGANASANFLFLKVAGGSGTTGIDWTKFAVQQRLSLSNSTVYTFNFWAKVGTAVTAAYAYIADKSGDTGGASFYKIVSLTGGTTWTKYSVTFDIPAIRALNSSLDYSTAYVGIGMNATYTTATPPLTANTWLYIDELELYAVAESIVPTITSTTPANVYIKTNPIPITITFNASVTGFTSSDLIVSNGSVSNFVAVSPTTYTADIVPIATGKVSVDIAASAAVDASAKPSVAANQFVRLVNRETTTGDYSNFSSICPVKDNKKAVYTFTADDGFTDAATFYNNEFKRLDLVGSLALVANWVNGAQTPASTYPFWNSILADGRIDIINHSKSHVKFSTITNTAIGQDSLYNEIIGNQSVFRTKFPGQDIITMANPSVVNTAAADVLIKQTHYAARNGGSGYNSLSPTDTEWFKLNMLANYFGSQTRAAYSTEINKYIDNTIANKQWLIILAHGIGTGANAMIDTAFTKHFEYVANKRADLWIGTFGDVTRYFREKQNASIITLDSTANRIAISLTHNLDANIFKYPLTLKTKVPANWASVTVNQALVTKNIASVLENGVSYIYYEAVPNGGNVVLTPAEPNALTQTKKNDLSNPSLSYQSSTSELTLTNFSNNEKTVKLFNSSGVECARYKVYNNKTIQLNSLKEGLYIAHCDFGNGQNCSTKIIIKK
jgi:hypothetical protein